MRALAELGVSVNGAFARPLCRPRGRGDEENRLAILGIDPVLLLRISAGRWRRLAGGGGTDAPSGCAGLGIDIVTMGASELPPRETLGLDLTASGQPCSQQTRDLLSARNGVVPAAGRALSTSTCPTTTLRRQPYSLHFSGRRLGLAPETAGRLALRADRARIGRPGLQSGSVHRACIDCWPRCGTE